MDFIVFSGSRRQGRGGGTLYTGTVSEGGGSQN